MWRGVIADDGLDGVAFGPEGSGYRHFIYQSLLARLKAEGVLLCAVSRNHPDVATAPLKSGRMVLKEPDFVAVVATYHAKSAQIAELAKRLNLGLDAFVFVDDNPVELAEVSLALPQVRCLKFPERDDALAAFLHELSSRFPRRTVTAEDRERTELYRRRLGGLAPQDLQGADLTQFLRGLEMTLTIHDRSRGDRARGVQLINKTNQFNLNGRRLTDDEIASVLEAGGRLYGASLVDRTGDHGEILACLVAPGGIIQSLVMSCRVFQRRVEYAFFAWLAAQRDPPRWLDWAGTPRNAPCQQFLADLTGSPPNGDGLVALDPVVVQARCAPDLAVLAVRQA